MQCSKQAYLFDHLVAARLHGPRNIDGERLHLLILNQREQDQFVGKRELRRGGEWHYNPQPFNSSGFSIVPTTPLERHLTAIIAADVVGYSRLMGADEKGTHLGLKEHRKQLIDRLVAAHKGHIVKTTGDGLLLRFPSVIEAVSFAVAMQSGMAKRNRDIALDTRIEFRIGVHIGDVIVEKGDVFGDGVNIAARLEQIAPPGGICLSEDVYRQVRGKLDIAIADAGEQSLKNISAPVRVYRIEPSVAATAEALTPAAEPGRRWPARTMAGAAITVAVALAAVIWVALLRDRPDVSRSAEPPKPIAVSAMPIIAVLPFANQTGDDSQDYFADGVTEEVINALGRFNTLRVIGRNAVLRYKKQAPTQEEIVSDLGANYLVGGSVRRSGKQVRIAAQLTDFTRRHRTVERSLRRRACRTFRFSGRYRAPDRGHAGRQHLPGRRPAVARPAEAESERLRLRAARPGAGPRLDAHGKPAFPRVDRRGD